LAAESPFIFLKGIHGTEIGKSPYDEKGAIAVKEIMAKDAEKGVEVVLPIDFVCSSEFGEGAEIYMALELGRTGGARSMAPRTRSPIAAPAEVPPWSCWEPRPLTSSSAWPKRWPAMCPLKVINDGEATALTDVQKFEACSVMRSP